MPIKQKYYFFLNLVVIDLGKIRVSLDVGLSSS